mmetsp:Transcript_26677/g.41757  ORF Transcript_26677/g.41757 Transcript_26677/m.41757 type:complete len:109 (-) Transcript_26677:1279-1605(-)
MGLLSWVGLGGSGEEVSSKSSDFTDEQRHVAQLTKTDKLKEVYQKQLASRFLNDLASQITKKCFEKCSAEGKYAPQQFNSIATDPFFRSDPRALELSGPCALRPVSPL